MDAFPTWGKFAFTAAFALSGGLCTTLNFVKLPPYYFLGELGAPNLTASASLLPFAVIATIAGGMIIKRMRMEVFYPLMYAMAGLAGLKLVLDGF